MLRKVFGRAILMETLRVLTDSISGSDTAHTASTGSMSLFDTAHAASILAVIRILYDWLLELRGRPGSILQVLPALAVIWEDTGCSIGNILGYVLRMYYSGVHEFRATRNRPEVPLLSPHRSYPHLRAICSYLGIRANSRNNSSRRAQKLLRRKKSGRNLMLFIAYSSWKSVQVDSSALKQRTAWMGHDYITSSWRELDNGSNNKKENAPSVHTPARPDSVPIRKLVYFRGLRLPSVQRYCAETKEAEK